jgi:hypothetical protein
MKHIFLSVLFLCCIPVAKAQKNNTRNELTADLHTFKAILQSAHAGLYKYRSKQQVDSIFEHYGKLINNSTAITAFYKYLSGIMSFIGSLHDDISLPGSMEENIASAKAFFPCPVKLVDGRLLVNADSLPIPAGAEILSVNGRKIKEVIPALYKYYTTDGFNITGKAEGIHAKFPWYYRLEYGAAREFTVIYKPYKQSAAITASLQPVTWKTYRLLYKKRHSLKLDTLFNDRYAFTIIDSLNTGMLTVTTFSLGNETSPKHAAYKQFLHNTFATLKEKHISNLVVDLRQNGGGSDPNDLLTFSYLAHHPFKENAEAFTLFQQLPYKQYCTDDTADIRELEENFRDEHNQYRDGKYFQNPVYNPTWQPDSLAFTGKVYLLIGPAVASAASLCASMVKSEGYATLIGEETMGGYYGHTGHNAVSYQLPGSHIPFTISVVDLKQYVNPKKEMAFGSGILPDIRIVPSQADFINNMDTVLQYTLRLIGSK